MPTDNGKPHVAVLASGGGTNLQSLIHAADDTDFPAQIALVICNVPGAYCLTRAKQANIPTALIDHRDFEDRAAFESEIDLTLRSHGIEYMCLAGFMRVLTEAFVNGWRDRMLNIHPSLLPAYKGLHTHRCVLRAGDELHGCTVHLVRPALDGGPMILQAEVPVLPGDTEDLLLERVLSREHVIYPHALALLASGKIDVIGEEAVIDGTPGPIRLTWKTVEEMLCGS